MPCDFPNVLGGGRAAGEVLRKPERLVPPGHDKGEFHGGIAETVISGYCMSVRL